MKDRIVIWGQDEKDTDVLIAIRLLQNSDIIKIWTFPKKGIDDTFVDALFKDWKDGAEDKFPQPHTLIERGITEENMLPEGLKTPKTDIIKIAEQEWRVRVLSFRLYEHIKQQIEQLKVRVGNLSVYSKDVWEEAKDVSRSIKENTLDRNIKREQTTELRKGIDEVFDQLKKLQNAEKSKFLEISKNNMVAIRTKVTDVLEKIGTERNSRKLWDKLLSYQQEAKGQEMTPRDRNALRLSFNEAFSALKADIQSNVGNRINSRINGLKDAIGKMEKSIKRDKDDVAYQSGRINKNSTTQLEYQLRNAKLKLIEDRIVSKGEKLHNMYLTLKDLEKKSDKLPKPKKVEIKTKTKVAAAAKPAVEKEDVAKIDIAKTEDANVSAATNDKNLDMVAGENTKSVAETQAPDSKVEESVDTKSEASVETKSEVPADINVEDAVETKLDAPVDANTEGAVETKSEIPVDTSAEEAVEIKSDAPVDANTEGAVETKSEVPVETKSETSVDTNTEDAVETKSETITNKADKVTETILEEKTEKPVEDLLNKDKETVEQNDTVVEQNTNEAAAEITTEKVNEAAKTIEPEQPTNEVEKVVTDNIEVKQEETVEKKSENE